MSAKKTILILSLILGGIITSYTAAIWPYYSQPNSMVLNENIVYPSDVKLVVFRTSKGFTTSPIYFTGNLESYAADLAENTYYWVGTNNISNEVYPMIQKTYPNGTLLWNKTVPIPYSSSFNQNQHFLSIDPNTGKILWIYNCANDTLLVIFNKTGDLEGNLTIKDPSYIHYILFTDNAHDIYIMFQRDFTENRGHGYIYKSNNFTLLQYFYSDSPSTLSLIKNTTFQFLCTKPDDFIVDDENAVCYFSYNSLMKFSLSGISLWNYTGVGSYGNYEGDTITLSNDGLELLFVYTFSNSFTYVPLYPGRSGWMIEKLSSTGQFLMRNCLEYRKAQRNFLVAPANDFNEFYLYTDYAWDDNNNIFTIQYKIELTNTILPLGIFSSIIGIILLGVPILFGIKALLKRKELMQISSSLPNTLETSKQNEDSLSETIIKP